MKEQAFLESSTGIYPIHPPVGGVEVDLVNSLGQISAVINLGYKDGDRQSSSFSLPSGIGNGVFFAWIRSNNFEGEPIKLIVTQ